MAQKNDSKVESATEVAPGLDTRKTCGIVMPISAIGDTYSEEHWRRVRKILHRAIERASMRPQLVWENPEVDVIQSAILQNLYENDVVVCDLSGLNPNVMLETGLRLSTKRPTVMVTDKVQPPPFDIGTIGYIEYQKDLEYNAIEDFIERLSKKITDVARAADEKTYKSFVEHFKFETVTPETVSITTDEYIRDRINDLTAAVRRIERAQRAPSSRPLSTLPRISPGKRPEFVEVGRLVFAMSDELAIAAEEAVDEISGLYCIREEVGPNRHQYVIKVRREFPDPDRELLMQRALETAAQFAAKYDGERGDS